MRVAWCSKRWCYHPFATLIFKMTSKQEKRVEHAEHLRFLKKEGINTLDGTGEVLLTILCSLAQEESWNLSENTRWGVVRRFEKGIVTVNHNKFMGYTKDKTGQLIIVPEEAEAVRKIFRLYLEGKSVIQIARALEREKKKTATGNDKWHDAVIYKILQNEIYGRCIAAKELYGGFPDQEKGEE